jgi:formylglycine-generating enzyme required for sulfatase activity
MITKTLNSWLWCGTLALPTAAMPVSAQTPPSLGLRLFAGVSITGAVGDIYVVQSTPDLAQTNSWGSLAFLQLPATNYLFVDTSGPAEGRRFYRALMQTPPPNLVFIRPNTFELGSPTNEVGRSPDEGPQTTVTISHGFSYGDDPNGTSLTN